MSKPMTVQHGRTSLVEPQDARSLVVRVPMTPSRDLSPNARVHYMRKSRAARVFREAAGWSAVQGRMEYLGRDPLFDTFVPGDPIFVGPVAITAVIGWGRGRKPMDPTNAEAALKAAVDGLQDAGIVANDRQVVRLDVTQERDKLGHGYVEFTITPIDQKSP